MIGLVATGMLLTTAWPLLTGGPIRPHSLIDRMLVAAGLGIDAISLQGHRHTTATDIFNLLAIDDERSLLGFDAALARRRLEQLPWVQTARLARVLPDTIRIEVVERRPIAVWLEESRHTLIDATGRRLAHVTATAAPDLPRVIGAGAPEAAAGLLEALALHPAIMSRLERARRMGARRWILELAGARMVHLPEHGLSSALQRLAEVEAAATADQQTGLVIDLRRDDVTSIGTEAPALARTGPSPKSAARSL